MKDWPDQDVLTASLSSTASTVSVVDGTLYPKNFHVEIDTEVMTVAANGIGSTFTVRRGQMGTTATSHASTSIVLIQPHFFFPDYLDAINAAMEDAFPLLYKRDIIATQTTQSGVFEYEVPDQADAGMPIQYISKVELRPSGETDFREVRDYSIRRGPDPMIQFHWEPDSGATIRVDGYSPFNVILSGETLNGQIRQNAISALIIGASSYLLASGEAGRVRADTGLIDAREQANRTGSSLSASNSLYQRYRSQLATAAMPRLPIHCKPTF